MKEKTISPQQINSTLKKRSQIHLNYPSVKHFQSPQIYNFIELKIIHQKLFYLFFNFPKNKNICKTKKEKPEKIEQNIECNEKIEIPT